MKHEFTLNNFILEISLLGESDATTLQSLCDACPDYYLLMEGQPARPNDGTHILSMLPPGKTPLDKSVFGIFHNYELIAVLDLVKNYKTTGEWMLGLLLIKPSFRGFGLGRYLINWCSSYVENNGGKIIRIAVVSENKKALSFWASLGFNEIERANLKIGLKEHEVIVMNYVLPHIV